MSATIQHPSISLCLSKSGEAAIVYVSPKGVTTVVARGPEVSVSPAFQVVAAVASFWADPNWPRKCAVSDVLGDIKERPHWAVTITARQLACILEGAEVVRHAG